MMNNRMVGHMRILGMIIGIPSIHVCKRIKSNSIKVRMATMIRSTVSYPLYALYPHFTINKLLQRIKNLLYQKE